MFLSALHSFDEDDGVGNESGEPDQRSEIMDKGNAMSSLKERMRDVTPLPDEPEFTTSDETIVRFLKSTGWKYKDAEKALLQTVEYRRKNQPLRLDCEWCHTRPGYHSMRQVGHDESGRPVVYANFAQASTHKNSVDDVIGHVTYLIENAKATMAPGSSTWVFVIDCTGMTLSACNPKLGYGMSNVLSHHYPERLGMVICVNHSPMFHGVWKALKKLLSPATVSKMRLVRSESKIRQAFSTFFPDDLSAWLLDEIALNRQKPLPQGQQEFWNPPPEPSTHDPRGCPSYVRNYLNGFSRRSSALVPGQPKPHLPHPNIVDSLGSRVKAVSLNPEEEAERAEAIAASADSYSASSGEDDLDDSNDEVDADVYNDENNEKNCPSEIEGLSGDGRSGSAGRVVAPPMASKNSVLQ
ncbi:SEC14 cytosolic factor [Aplysia californica]|uniref:SEC14 cytosolic factor n=1 Tax=Aplysia californica TaxID=6500 RepID=A0ABM1VUD2_APLCA|nr:SEC14 cytosolic factor [Aplysia californica]